MSHQRNSRLASVRYVLSRQLTGGVSIAAIDRLENGPVFGDRNAGPSGQRERRLSEASDRIVKLPNHLQQGAIVRGFAQRFVELHGQIADVGMPDLLARELDLLVDPVQAGTFGHCRLLGGDAGGKLIECGPYREHLKHLLLRDCPDDEPAAHLAQGEMLRFQTEDGLTNRSSADAELTRQMLFRQTIARSEMADEDRFAKRGIGRVGGSPGPSMREP
jgi:hypothetical protein